MKRSARSRGEMDQLLSALPPKGKLTGEALRRFDELVMREGLAQSEELLRQAEACGLHERAEWERGQIRSFRKMLGEPHGQMSLFSPVP